MTPPAIPNPYKRHHFPGEIISHAVWLYYRLSLSHRDVEELLLERGIIVSYEAIRKWCRKFGQDYANKLRRVRGRNRKSAVLSRGATWGGCIRHPMLKLNPLEFKLSTPFWSSGRRSDPPADCNGTPPVN